ncbi:sarcolemmal membrane-associated protein [Venturia canescens]|uniref:sarcolemmal membrane-associated protein n=1 Tax=Venturia canescens TaxID=32260 RepID=UPI001C9D213E|nr:sarcolemmal membrane-associated protein [Venturia canescens]
MVVANGCWVHNAGFNQNQNGENNLNNESNNNKMTAKGILICRDNSHAFQERTLNLDQAVKIGRSVARARVATNNAIFDCKVLSRNHALLWYSGGKFYLQDTKSSNGTFVNNQRLSATGLESTPREVCSGDIVQFGVDVMESTKKVTHGCIVATLKLYLPDGKEAKASRTMAMANPAGDVSLEDLYKLNQYIQEASRREKVLQSKLSHLQSLVENTRLATDQSWKALIDEDRLLTRIKAVESQLVACSKNLSEDKIRSELLRLEEEKAQYQIAAKDALHKIHQEKLEVTQKLAQLESRLNETEEECQSLHNVSKHAQLELQELAAKYTEAQRNLQFMENKMVEKEESSSEIVKWAMQEKKDLLKKVEEQARVERFLQARLRNCWLEDPVNIPKHITAMRNYMQTLIDMNPKLVTDVDSSLAKDGVNPIEAINGILNKLDAMLTEIHNETEAINDTNLTSLDNEQNQTNTQDSENKQMLIKNTEERPFDKNELDDSPNKRENTTNYIVKPAGVLTTTVTTSPTARRQQQQQQQQMRGQKSLNRRTLVNGSTANLDDSAEFEANTENNDDTSSIASDDTWIGFNDEVGEKSVIEVKKQSSDDYEDNATSEDQQREQQISRESGHKLEVRFASGTNGKDLEEVHYDHAYRPEEEFADVATAANDDDSSDSIESPNESPASSVTSNRQEFNKDDEDIEKPENLEHDDEHHRRAEAEQEEVEPEEDEQLDGDYIKTLKPIGNSISPNSSQTREYVLRTLIGSLESLRGEDDHEAQQVVKRELDQLRDWLVQETSENIVNKLKELYYRAKNENQRIQEVNEELVILKEKYNNISYEKTELLKQYKTLKAQCGDLLNTSYSVPIQYVAPIAVVIVWMLLEKMF